MPYKYNPFTRMLDLVQNGSSGGSSGELQTGSIIWWPQNTPPEGWLKCDGSLVSKVDYPELFDVIGYTFGQQEGTTVVLEATHTDYTSETGTASASSEYSTTNYFAWYAVDDDLDYIFKSSTANAGEWWQYEFNSPKKVTTIKAYVLQPIEVKVEASNTDEFVTLTTVTLTGNQWNVIDIPEDVQGEYLKYRLTKTKDDNMFKLAEITFEQYIPPDPNLFGLPNISTSVNNVIPIIKT